MMRVVTLRPVAALFLTVVFGTAASDQDPPASPRASPAPVTEEASDPMTNGRLDRLIRRVDDKAEGKDGFWRFSVRDYQVTVITDDRVDRMRILVPIAKADGLDQEMLHRLLQANFDSTLDARYSIAKGVLWSAFIHPLGSLDDEQFLSGLGQTVNLVVTFGTTYSSGALVFGGGDSKGLQEKQLIEELVDKGKAI